MRKGKDNWGGGWVGCYFQARKSLAFLNEKEFGFGST
jgi:hypothetical protein